MKSEDLQRIIRDAIDNEVEAYTFYRSVAERAKDEDLKTIFLELAEDEKQHRECLQDVLLGSIEKMEFEAPEDYRVTDAMEEPELSVDMKPLEGLLLAIKKELHAAQMGHPACRGKHQCGTEDGL